MIEIRSLSDEEIDAVAGGIIGKLCRALYKVAEDIVDWLTEEEKPVMAPGTDENGDFIPVEEE